MSAPRLLPEDAHNARLLANVHPPGWQNPQPDGRYNLVVIGAGSAGLITSLVAAGLGARVALVERHLMGGDCLNTGCVPSKSLLHSARHAHAQASSAEPDFARAMERMREIRARISAEDAAARYRDEFGVDVFLGDARFASADHVEVRSGEQRVRLEFAKAVLATGARPSAPPIPGLAESGYFDNESIFTLTERPARLAVIGAGPIGCELAQAFARLGSRVTLFSNAAQILPREDPAAARVLQDALEADGIELRLRAQVTRVEGSRAAGETIVHSEGAAPVAADALLVAVGRAPNVEGLGLAEVGVAHDARRGIHVDDFLRSSNPRIYAAGDCCMEQKFTHAADAAAKLVVQNALFALGPFGRARLSGLLIPWCTYTDPEIAHVGLYEHEARARGVAVDVYEAPLAATNRAVTDGEETGFAKVVVRRGSDRVLGATIVGSHAGELIGQVVLGMKSGVGLRGFGNLIYAYPTRAEVLKRVAGAYLKGRVTERLLAILRRVFAARRRWKI